MIIEIPSRSSELQDHVLDWSLSSTSIPAEFGRTNDAMDQGRRSLRSQVVDLGVRLADSLPGGLGYRCRLTDNGSEALVVVLEQAYNLRLRALRAIHESIREIVSDLWLRAASGESVDVPGGGNLVDFLDDLEQRNLGALESFERHPVVLCFEGAGLGRGQGAIDTRLRKICREGLESRIEVREVVLDPDLPECVAQAMDVHRCHFRVPRLRDGKVEMEVRRESLVFAFALDGEKALSLPGNALERLAAHRGALPLVIEENLIGCGLRGDLYAFERTPLATARPEYIVLNKLFAGWGAKIGAALVRDDSVEEGFDNSCAAGFGEDEFSLEVALAVFDALDAVDRAQSSGRNPSQP